MKEKSNLTPFYKTFVKRPYGLPSRTRKCDHLRCKKLLPAVWCANVGSEKLLLRRSEKVHGRLFQDQLPSF